MERGADENQLAVRMEKPGAKAGFSVFQFLASA
jgi:hypothetical protein